MDDDTSSIRAFIKRFVDVTDMPPEDADLFKALDIYGDDADEFIVEFGQRFDVDVGGYLWYFHTREECWNPGALFFKPPNRRVTPIPISVSLLRKAQLEKHWPITYPVHALPKRRWDILISQVVCLFPLALVGLGLILKFVLH
ncbi:DUF1493 family protein [Asticcacaulis sp. 201]|uniref:DUF1493 family protein n=1 Tax=Asticcacaulis sp. 201 TaxID=3028787 RepID=UPI002916B6CD|nr:DUF1493 family protein [Asticcacaulis sp. 201]MDV6329934.1 DUF1493 family protein [Asticcacaulis sp. 201]